MSLNEVNAMQTMNHHKQNLVGAEQHVFEDYVEALAMFERVPECSILRKIFEKITCDTCFASFCDRCNITLVDQNWLFSPEHNGT